MKPLLAHTVENPEKVTFPVLASPKLDGVRCLTRGGAAITRTLKPIPNVATREALSILPDLDGELILGNPTDPGVFKRSQSAAMTFEGTPDLTLWVFDTAGGEAGFSERYAKAVRAVDDFRALVRVEIVAHELIHDSAALMEYESEMVAAGYEGVMIRDPSGPYKFGRSTEKQGILGKVKRFKDADAEIIGVAELQHNENAAELDALGHTKRSTHAEGKRAGGTLGALICRAPGWAETFKVGTGFTAADRAELWAIRDTLPGQFVKFKYQPSGTADAPRFPSFLGLRDSRDIVTS
jgi:DNA ligase-1